VVGEVAFAGYIIGAWIVSMARIVATVGITTAVAGAVATAIRGAVVVLPGGSLPAATGFLVYSSFDASVKAGETGRHGAGIQGGSTLRRNSGGIDPSGGLGVAINEGAAITRLVAGCGFSPAGSRILVKTRSEADAYSGQLVYQGVAVHGSCALCRNSRSIDADSAIDITGHRRTTIATRGRLAIVGRCSVIPGSRFFTSPRILVYSSVETHARGGEFTYRGIRVQCGCTLCR
jgi:hypothetical protein